MSRFARILLLVVLLGSSAGASAVAAQEATDVPIGEIPAATESPADVPAPGILSAEELEALPVLVSARADLEVLATSALGSAQRPPGWSGNADVNDTQLPLLIRLDLETLAGSVMGADNRPAGWFGVVASVPLAVARDIRHDLELLADVVVGAPSLRPPGWKGDDPFMRCSRSTQALFTMLRNAGITLQIDFAQAGYCDALEIAASQYVESHVLQPPVASDAPTDQGHYAYHAENPYAVAFLDRRARQKIGVLPVGTGFEVVGRSDADFSNMMLVRGDDFQVFVDYTTTPLTGGEFLALPQVGAGAETYCGAAWCGVGVD